MKLQLYVIKYEDAIFLQVRNAGSYVFLGCLTKMGTDCQRSLGMIIWSIVL